MYVFFYSGFLTYRVTNREILTLRQTTFSIPRDAFFYTSTPFKQFSSILLPFDKKLVTRIQVRKTFDAFLLHEELGWKAFWWGCHSGQTWCEKEPLEIQSGEVQLLQELDVMVVDSGSGSDDMDLRIVGES